MYMHHLCNYKNLICTHRYMTCTYTHMYTNLKRLPLCWFILARGATPSTAMKNTFCGLIILNNTCKPITSNNAHQQNEVSYLNIMEYISKHGFFGHSEMWVTIVGMCTCVYYPVHVQVQVVEIWNLRHE